LGPGQTEACKVSRCCTKLLSEELSRCRCLVNSNGADTTG
jgi:hypothetical protein